MSFKASVEARCPSGCEGEFVEVWSFVRGDKEENLRDRILTGELNLILCSECGKHFSPDSTVIYQDAGAELLAFVFPESKKDDAPQLKEKMSADYLKMKEVPGMELPLGAEPICLFGLRELSELLHEDDSLEDEVMVAGHYCRELGLAEYYIDRAFARKRGLPRMLPLAPGGKEFDRRRAVQGIDSLLKRNDALESFGRWKNFLESSDFVPPGARR